MSEQGPDFVQVVANQEGFLTLEEIKSLYKLVKTFFLQGDVDKRGDLLREFHGGIHSIE